MSELKFEDILPEEEKTLIFQDEFERGGVVGANDMRSFCLKALRQAKKNGKVILVQEDTVQKLANFLEDIEWDTQEDKARKIISMLKGER